MKSRKINKRKLVGLDNGAIFLRDDGLYYRIENSCIFYLNPESARIWQGSGTYRNFIEFKRCYLRSLKNEYCYNFTKLSDAEIKSLKNKYPF